MTTEQNSTQRFIEQVQEVLGAYGVQLDPHAPELTKPPVNYGEVLQATQGKINELNQQADALVAAMGMTREQLEEYAKNPNNFSKEQWDSLQKVKQECDNFKEATMNSLRQASQAAVDELKQQKKDFEKNLNSQGNGKDPKQFNKKKKKWMSC